MKRKLQCKLQDDGTCLINLDDAVKMVEYEEIADAMCLEVLLQDDLATAQVKAHNRIDVRAEVIDADAQW